MGTAMFKVFMHRIPSARQRYAFMVSQIIVILALCGCARAETNEDPCSFVLFDRSSQIDYSFKKEQLLATSAEFRTANLALAQARLEVTKRVDKDLIESRFKAETARRESLSSAGAADISAAISKACLDRLDRFPKAEVAAVSESAKRLQALLALSASQFREQHTRDTKTIERDYGSSELRSEPSNWIWIDYDAN